MFIEEVSVNVDMCMLANAVMFWGNLKSLLPRLELVIRQRREKRWRLKHGLEPSLHLRSRSTNGDFEKSVGGSVGFGLD